MATQSMTRTELVALVAEVPPGKEVRVVIRRRRVGPYRAFGVYLSIGDVVAKESLSKGLGLPAAQREAEMFRKWLAEADRKDA